MRSSHEQPRHKSALVFIQPGKRHYDGDTPTTSFVVSYQGLPLYVPGYMPYYALPWYNLNPLGLPGVNMPLHKLRSVPFPTNFSEQIADVFIWLPMFGIEDQPPILRVVLEGRLEQMPPGERGAGNSKPDPPFRPCRCPAAVKFEWHSNSTI